MKLSPSVLKSEIKALIPKQAFTILLANSGSITAKSNVKLCIWTNEWKVLANAYFSLVCAVRKEKCEITLLHSDSHVPRISLLGSINIRLPPRFLFIARIWSKALASPFGSPRLGIKLLSCTNECPSSHLHVSRSSNVLEVVR